MVLWDGGDCDKIPLTNHALRMKKALAAISLAALLLSACQTRPEPDPVPDPNYPYDQESSENKPMFMTTMTHMEGGHKDDTLEAMFNSHITQLTYAMDLADEYDAVLTIESEKPFARANTTWDYNFMAEIVERGHGVGTHCDIGATELMDYDDFVAALIENKELVDELVGEENNKGCSGAGGPNDWVQGALDAGFDYIDGLVGFHLLAFDLEDRIEPWTNQEIYGGAYHYSIPTEYSERIEFIQLADTEDWIDDSEGLVLSNGEFGQLAYLEEGGWRECGSGDKFTGCEMNKNDVDAFVEIVMEMDEIRDHSEFAKLSLYFPSNHWSEDNEETLTYFFSEMQRLQNEGIIQWSSQLDAVEAFSSGVAPEPTASELPSQEELYTIVSLNVHDWVNPDESSATINKVIDLHEEYEIPVGIYITDPTFQNFVEMEDPLLNRLVESDYLELGYHFRPPYPAYSGFDNVGLSQMNEDELYELFMDYETQALDLETGELTDEPGGLQYIIETLGEAPIVAGLGSTMGKSREALANVFSDFGVIFTIARNGVDLGDTEYDFYLRPEHFDLKLYEKVNAFSKEGTSAGEILEEATSQLVKADQGPQVLGIKYHENNFYYTNTPFAPCMWEDGDKSKPLDSPYDLDLCYDGTKGYALRTIADQKAHWDLYEATLAHLAENRNEYNPIGLEDLMEMLDL